GRLSVALRYSYGSQQLLVRVLRARDLPAKDPNGFSDPYVKIYLLPDRKKKFQTKVLRRTLNPEWDETFSFGVPFGELPARRLHFSVYDFDRFIGHNEVIGLCRVGSDADGPGREHWAQMLANPRKPIEHWHTLVEVR
ncbi:SYT3 protein, partial [Dicrurus megarhynchus]|nr:SYT3 protein [Dicrurus megarhynchus]